MAHPTPKEISTMTHDALAAGEICERLRRFDLARVEREHWNATAIINEAADMLESMAFRTSLIGRLTAENATLLAELTAANASVKEALEKIDEFDKNYFAPWGSWKTAWWEGEVSDDAEFCDGNALKHVINIVRAALDADREGRSDG